MSIRKLNRIIGEHNQGERGPLLLTIGGIHGNEPAGVKAIDLMSKMLEVEPITNPEFVFRGTFLGIIGNKKAYRKNKRYSKKDLNRSWTKDNVHRIKKSDKSLLTDESLEIKEIIDLLEAKIEEYNPTKLIVLDLHTTSSAGGIFTIPCEDVESLAIAAQMKAPVIQGMLNGLSGTTLHYFRSKNMRIPTTALTFESGQHEEPLSINRAIAAITLCMRSIGMVEPRDIESQHEKILREHTKDLPKMVELRYRHEIVPAHKFKMKEGYQNFQSIEQGDHLATDVNGKIIANESGRILMPLYQKQGEDGFFIVRDIGKEKAN